MLNPLPLQPPSRGALRGTLFEEILKASDTISQDCVAMRDDIGNSGTGRMQFFINGLGPRTYLCSTARAGRIDGVLRECVFDVFADHSGFWNHERVMHEDWHHRFRIECQKFRTELLAAKNIDHVPAPRKMLFFKRESHLCGACRRTVMI